jgi:hypothetical protein
MLYSKKPPRYQQRGGAQTYFLHPHPFFALLTGFFAALAGFLVLHAGAICTLLK